MSVHRYRVLVGERELEVEVERGQNGPRVRLGGEPVEARLEPPDATGSRRFWLEGRQLLVNLQGAGERFAASIDGLAVDVTIEDLRRAELTSFGGGVARQVGQVAVKAPMPGLVVGVNVVVGQQVAAGERLVVLQAMKMENELGSPREGTVASVLVEPGQAVEQGQILVELE